ncbi:hypothetical protein QFZ79_002665 [Arthrobacter sp. V4I6]|uniref:hypothetical protein n=1 Tax=unclassified Arthrobacter TaxID=235627 RepID=UPI00278A51D5|nr:MULTISPECIES: hypothetical protein [unclassified Arthrobacter]MDQ0820373.1 hypothetical protein [Arthrobacter sp. V1I7]MDQ0854554.1 hypothetical protein [Arthrobacter sp. V4I6]
MTIAGQPVSVPEDPIVVPIEQSPEGFSIALNASRPQPVVLDFNVPHALYCPEHPKRLHRDEKSSKEV